MTDDIRCFIYAPLTVPLNQILQLYADFCFTTPTLS